MHSHSGTSGAICNCSSSGKSFFNPALTLGIFLVSDFFPCPPPFFFFFFFFSFFLFLFFFSSFVAYTDAVLHTLQIYCPGCKLLQRKRRGRNRFNVRRGSGTIYTATSHKNSPTKVTENQCITLSLSKNACRWNDTRPSKMSLADRLIS